MTFRRIYVTLAIICLLSNIIPVFADNQPTNIGYDYYLPITINASDIDEDLTDFPVLVHLSASCGINGFDATNIFNEIGDNYNWTAYSDADGNRYYWELDTWNSTENEAFVWVKIPLVSSTSDTTFYFWFERFEDGSTYNNTAEVWSNGYVGVWHMNDNPDTSHVMDSTSNNNDGAKKGANEPIEAAGKIGKAQDFAGNPEDIESASTDFQFGVNPFTVSCWIKPSVINQNVNVIGKSTNFNDERWEIFQLATNKVRFLINDGTEDSVVSTTSVTTMDWLHIVGVRNGTTTKLYVNGVQEGGDQTINAGDSFSGANNLCIGRQSYTLGNYFQGLIDEIQVSKGVARSSAWVGASYKTQNDSFITYGTITDYTPINYVRGSGLILVVLAIILGLIVMGFFLKTRE